VHIAHAGIRRRINGLGENMRYGTLALAVMLTASMSTAVFAQQTKRTKAKHVAMSAQPVNPNENTLRLLKDSLPLWVPMPVRIYMLQQQSDAARKPVSR
jgi:hypothetical protein